MDYNGVRVESLSVELSCRVSGSCGLILWILLGRLLIWVYAWLFCDFFRIFSKSLFWICPFFVVALKYGV